MRNSRFLFNSIGCPLCEIYRKLGLFLFREVPLDNENTVSVTVLKRTETSSNDLMSKNHYDTKLI